MDDYSTVCQENKLLALLLQQFLDLDLIDEDSPPGESEELVKLKETTKTVLANKSQTCCSVLEIALAAYAAEWGTPSTNPGASHEKCLEAALRAAAPILSRPA